MRKPATLIAEEAAHWVARIDREGDAAALRAEMQRWSAGDDRHAGALLRAEAAWMMLDRAAVLDGAGFQQADGGADGEGVAVAADVVRPDIAKAERARQSRSWRWGGGLAAAAAVLALVMTPSLFSAQTQQIETAMGEIRRVPLADGSFAAVNTDSKVEIALKTEQRNVVMERGEAWFQVAKDPERPFVVEAGDVRVRAVGTAFSVQMLGDNVDVRVTEGVVEVWRVGQEEAKHRVHAGRQMSVGDDGAAQTLASAEPIERALSWRDGQLVFDGDSVGDAAEKFNRYNVVKIVVADNKLAREKMVGRFRTNEPQAFARAVAAILDAKVDVRDDRITLSAH